ncbi:HD-GYP domain-containing protein [Paludibacterium yongneupense]|uniref:HD-GYP domain-containing protein n=1 Tax=Paludibacterium yongneupense TaxID=400061 RepID=UPI000419AC7B|nr:HD domain-containing phosphohydrolase [Paludibacterium yongneupense]
MIADMQDSLVDMSGFQDFRDAMSDYAPRVETLVAELRREPGRGDSIADLFRTFHNIKGDAGLCRLHFVVPLIHAAENLLVRVRSRELSFTPSLADVLLFTVDRLEMAMDALAAGQALDSLNLPVLGDNLAAVAALPPREVEAGCDRILGLGTGGRDKEAGVDALFADDGKRAVAPADDLAFFHDLALQMETHSPIFSGRSVRNLKLARSLNEMGGMPVPADQLEAAVYMHDIGMMMVPGGLWLGGGRLRTQDLPAVQSHVAWAAGLLERMPGWREAALIVRQHHEKPDGSGYPAGLVGEAICPGARILALVDAFEAVLTKQGARGQVRSLLRAVAEVNACEYQFDRAWVEVFNRAIRAMHDALPGAAVAKIQCR